MNYTNKNLNKLKQNSNCGQLFVVATPIGNLDDITLRALETLKAVEYIVCEDTRVTQKLLNHYGIKKKLIVYNDHSTTKERDKIINILSLGAKVALVSDAGTPLISDPGYKLINQAIVEHINVIPVPGASALIGALCVAGLPTNKFIFLGFPDSSENSFRKELKNYQNLNITMIFYESPKRLITTLKVLQEELGNRKAVIARELTKIYEEVLRDRLDELIKHYENKEVKGEIVLVIEGANEEEITDERIANLLNILLPKMSHKDAVKEISDN